MKKKTYIVPSVYCKDCNLRTHLVANTIYESKGFGTNGFSQQSLGSKDRDNSNSFGSTYADEISTSGSIWDF